MRYVALVLALIGCAPNLPQNIGYTSEQDRQLLGRVTSEWRDLGFPYPDACVPELVHVTVAPDDTFRDLCHRCAAPVGFAPGDRVSLECGQFSPAYACFSAERWGSATSRAVPIIVVSENWGDRFEPLFLHEAVHWLEWCSGVDQMPQHRTPYWLEIVKRIPEAL